MESKRIWSVVRKSPTWKPEDYQSIDALKRFCFEQRSTLDKGDQPDGNLAFIWANVAYAVWGALRARGDSVAIPREPTIGQVLNDPSTAVRSLDAVILWCDAIRPPKGGRKNKTASELDTKVETLWQEFRSLTGRPTKAKVGCPKEYRDGSQGHVFYWAKHKSRLPKEIKTVEDFKNARERYRKSGI